MNVLIEESKFEKKKKKTRIIKKVVKLIHLHHEIAGKKGRLSFIPHDSNRSGAEELHDISIDQFNEENSNRRGSSNGKLTPKHYRYHNIARKEKDSRNNMDEIKLFPMNRV